MLDTTTTTPPDSTPVPARSPAPSPAHSPWTAERIEQLRNGVTSGLSCSQIAAEIGVTRNAVIGKIHRLGLSPGRPAAPARSCP
ncbi:MAG: GcrA family cell cycle regulator, partial [Xanthobacteraceae bacterium]